MRLLLDEELLETASEEFDALVTMDDKLPDQQNLAASDLAVVILPARSKNLADLAELIPETERLLPTLTPGEARRVHSP